MFFQMADEIHKIFDPEPLTKRVSVGVMKAFIWDTGTQFT